MTARPVQEACQRCRHRRAKCDGLSPCGRCNKNGETCAYTGKQWVSKSDLRAQVEWLRQRLRNKDVPQSQDVSNLSTATGDTLQDWVTTVESLDPEKESLGWQFDRAPVVAPSIFFLANSENASNPLTCYHQLLSWRSCHPIPIHPNGPVSISSQDSSAELLSPSATSHAYHSPSQQDTWTRVGWTRLYVRYIFDMLTYWDNVVFGLVQKEEFLRDFEAGHGRFCSLALVHALLALCTKLIDEGADDSQLQQSGWRRSNKFLVDTEALLRNHESSDSLPDIQALGVLSLYYFRCGQERTAREYAGSCFSAARKLCHRQTAVDASDDRYSKVRTATYCGALSLCRMLRLTTGLIFNDEGDALHKQCTLLEPLPCCAVDLATTDPNASATARRKPELVNADLLNVKIFQLTEWVYTLISSTKTGPKPTRDDILSTYTKCLSWYQDLFDVIGGDGSRSPFIIFVHMYYHFCLLCAFRPFVGSKIIISELRPHEICAQAAESIISLAKSYDDSFSLRLVSACIPYFVCTSGLFCLAVQDNECSPELESLRLTAETAVAHAEKSDDAARTHLKPLETTSQAKVSAVSQARQLLSRMASTHHVAAIAEEILRESLVNLI